MFKAVATPPCLIGLPMAVSAVRLVRNPAAQCRLECIFNASQALQTNRLNMTYVRPMLERAYTNEKQLIEAYRRGFAECAPLVRAKFEELSKMSKQNAACDRHALFYSLCAYAKLMKHCPSSVWQSNNKQCQTARNYVEKCPWTALKAFMSNT